MNVGCFFGTFDPPHNGHVEIAAYMLEHAGLDEVWLVITPQNPFKVDTDISPSSHRVAMAGLAIAGIKGLRVSEDELALPQPNYTARTLEAFRQRWPQHRFAVIMGSDNLAEFGQWKDPGLILAHHRVLVYLRPGSMMHVGQAEYAGHANVELMDAPLMDLSSTRIRRAIREGQNVEGKLPVAVLAYIQAHGLYADQPLTSEGA